MFSMMKQQRCEEMKKSDGGGTSICRASGVRFLVEGVGGDNMSGSGGVFLSRLDEDPIRVK